MEPCCILKFYYFFISVNPKDFEDLKKKPKDFYFDVSFDGIALHLAHQQQNMACTHVSGQW